MHIARFSGPRSTILFLVLVFILSGASAKAKEFVANDYGAKGDGATLATGAIQAAIDRASASGGTVILRPGTYLSGALFVKSGVTLRIDSGVTIRGVRELSAYPLMPTRVAGIEMSWPAALINVYHQRNVTITGSGTIDGDGKYWWDRYWALRGEYQPRGLRWAADYDAQRPRLIQIFNSSNVRLSKLRLERSGFWTVHICYSHDVTVDGVTIRNNIDGHGPSTDGIDIDSSSNILVEDADIEVNDDALCLKAGRDADGLRVNRPTEDVVIRNSTVRAGAAGVTFGSETSGGFRHIEVSGIHVMNPVPVAILFKSAHTRGGVGEDIRIDNIDAEGVKTVLEVNLNWNPSYSYATIPPDAKNIPPYWRVLATPVPAGRGLPQFRDVTITGVKATGAKAAFNVAAYKDAPLTAFRLEHWDVKAQTAGRIADARDWSVNDVAVHTADGSRVTLIDSTGKFDFSQ